MYSSNANRKIYPVKSNKLLKIHDYLEVAVSDNCGNDIFLKCEIEDVVQDGVFCIYKIFVPHPYKIKM